LHLADEVRNCAGLLPIRDLDTFCHDIDEEASGEVFGLGLLKARLAAEGKECVPDLVVGYEDSDGISELTGAPSVLEAVEVAPGRAGTGTAAAAAALALVASGGGLSSEPRLLVVVAVKFLRHLIILLGLSHRFVAAL
jgi:hypothetical protein